MIKDWVIILGSLFILVIIIDGIRRKRNERYGKIRMSSTMRKRAKQFQQEQEQKEEQPSYVSELPNGGARVIGHREPSEVVQGLLKPAKSQLPKHQAKNTESPKPQRQPEQTQLSLDESVPMLMESVDASNQRIEPNFGEQDHQDYAVDDDYEGEDFDSDDSDYENDIDSDYQEDDDYDEVFDDEEDLEDEEDSQQSESKNPPAAPDEVFVVHVMATQNPFKGSALLDTILQCGMRFGEMDIFHRYADTKGQGAALFSMANMVKPGIFDLDAMDEFETPGVSFFMTLPINADSMQTFDLMIDTARAVAGTLGGEIRDDQRSVMTKQTLEHCRERIRDYERQRLFRRLK
jgi:cell division protein ZipA